MEKEGRPREEVTSKQPKVTYLSGGADYRGLVNLGTTDPLNCLAQTLFMTPEFRRSLYHWDAGQLTAAEQADCWPLQLQRLFARLQFGLGSAAVPTRALNQSFRDPSCAGGPDQLYALQHNLRALCLAAFDLLAERFAGTPQGWFLSSERPSLGLMSQLNSLLRLERMLQELFQWRLLNYVQCLACGFEVLSTRPPEAKNDDVD
jgi:hypothetical protein